MDRKVTLVPLLIALRLVLFAPSAYAAPGAPLVGFASETLEFLTNVLGPIVFGIGLAICALGLIMGNRDALQRGIWSLVGGAMLFSIGQIVGFVQSAT